MIIYLLRHGTTAWNAQYKIQGKSDIPLDALGEAIAEATGTALKQKGICFEHVFSSPLSRAKRTAQLVSQSAAVHTDPRLIELSFGRFEGRTVPDLFGDPTCIFRFFKDDPERYNEEIIQLLARDPEGGYESLSLLLQRTGSFVREMIDPLSCTQKEDSYILIAGHGALNSALMMSFTDNKDLRSFWGKGLQKNCGIIKLVSHSDSSGNIRYETDGESFIVYDPEAFKVRDLL